MSRLTGFENSTKYKNVLNGSAAIVDMALTERDEATNLTISDLGNGKGYQIAREDARCLTISEGGLPFYAEPLETGFSVFSVTYHS